MENQLFVSKNGSRSNNRESSEGFQIPPSTSKRYYQGSLGSAQLNPTNSYLKKKSSLDGNLLLNAPPNNGENSFSENYRQNANSISGSQSDASTGIGRWRGQEVESNPSKLSERDNLIKNQEYFNVVGEIQAFGCLLVVEEVTFRILSISQNAAEMLELPVQSSQQTPSWELALGMDARVAFTPASVQTLEKATSSQDFTVVSPIMLSIRQSGSPMYAILHRTEHGIMIDFEPLQLEDPERPVIGALASHKLALKAVARLKSLSLGELDVLCTTVAEEIAELTGYDRVMVYRFHEDEHGEVIAECRNNLTSESYLGIHFPATDIPPISRRGFIETRVRMIVDAKMEGVPVIQHSKLNNHLNLNCCTLRGVQGCHREYLSNMSVNASLVLSAFVNSENTPNCNPSSNRSEGRKLWGLVVCHHMDKCFVPYPTRSACEFLMQVFGVHLNKELDLANQLKTKHILRMQTLLCDMLLREPPVALVTQTPNISDIVKCDGAALLYQGVCWRLGSSPSDDQIRNVAEWLLHHHSGSSGFSTDSLLHAGYPRAEELGEGVCGLIAVNFCDNNFLMWFRGHTARDVKWGGAKHDECALSENKLTPRKSFSIFLETVRMRSKPWDGVELDAVQSLNLILRSAMQEHDESRRRQLVRTRVSELRLQRVDEINQVANETVRIIETATVPILAVDNKGYINGWNMQIAKLTGVPVDKAMGRSLVSELVMEESRQTAQSLLLSSMQGHEESDVEIQLKVWRNGIPAGSLVMLVNSCVNRDVNDKIVGVCLVGQDITTQKIVLDKYIRCEGDYRTIIHSANPLIPPILGMDEYGACCEWSTGMVRLTGCPRNEVIGKLLLGEVFGLEMAMLTLIDEDAMTELEIVVNCAMEGHDDADNHPFTFIARDGRRQDVLLTVSKRSDVEGRVTGVFCFLHALNRDVQEALKAQARAESLARTHMEQLEGVREALGAPLEGMSFVLSSLDRSGSLNPDQMQLVETAVALQDQMCLMLSDIGEDSSMDDTFTDLQRVEFSLVTVLNAALSQGSSLALAKGQRLLRSVPPRLRIRVIGDPTRLQQVLASCVRTAISYTPLSGWVELRVDFGPLNDVCLQEGEELLRFQVAHSGDGLPGQLVQVLIGRRGGAGSGQQAMALRLCRKLVQVLGGELGYSFESGQCCFRLDLSLPIKQTAQTTENSRNN
uniref:Phytochrome n=1 Tax=Spirogyra varians TaxID=332125 RepID=A0A3G5EB73_9VIRI|nr:phytochrome [Spirogyra varians]